MRANLFVSGLWMFARTLRRKVNLVRESGLLFRLKNCFFSASLFFAMHCVYRLPPFSLCSNFHFHHFRSHELASSNIIYGWKDDDNVSGFFFLVVVVGVCSSLLYYRIIYHFFSLLLRPLLPHIPSCPYSTFVSFFMFYGSFYRRWNRIFHKSPATRERTQNFILLACRQMMTASTDRRPYEWKSCLMRTQIFSDDATARRNKRFKFWFCVCFLLSERNIQYSFFLRAHCRCNLAASTQAACEFCLSIMAFCVCRASTWKAGVANANSTTGSLITTPNFIWWVKSNNIIMCNVQRIETVPYESRKKIW